MPKSDSDEHTLLLTVPREEAENRIRDRISGGMELLEREINSAAQLEAVRHDYYKWSDYNTELLKRIFTNASISNEYSTWIGFVVGGQKSLYEEIFKLREDVNEKVRRLDSIQARLELIPIGNQVQRIEKLTGVPTVKNRTRIFVVHGHDEAAKEMVARFVERLGLEAVILHEQANTGRTIIEKLEHHSDVGFALVLLTPDDVGAAAGDKENLQSRARQNVVFELGLFIGVLGRHYVAALYKGPLELPSDYQGVVYIPIDPAGGWRVQVAKELKEAGFDIDMNRAL